MGTHACNLNYSETEIGDSWLEVSLEKVSARTCWQDKLKRQRSRILAQVVEQCLASTRPWVQILVLKRKNKIPSILFTNQTWNPVKSTKSFESFQPFLSVSLNEALIIPFLNYWKIPSYGSCFSSWLLLCIYILPLSDILIHHFNSSLKTSSGWVLTDLWISPHSLC
jgi:hypothetical protein